MSFMLTFLLLKDWSTEFIVFQSLGLYFKPVLQVWAGIPSCPDYDYEGEKFNDQEETGSSGEEDDKSVYKTPPPKYWKVFKH